MGRENLKVSSGRLHVAGVPAFDEPEVVKLVKKLYYSARGASTPDAIWRALEPRVANVTAKKVRRIVGSFETYQVTKRVPTGATSTGSPRARCRRTRRSRTRGTTRSTPSW